MNLPVRGFFLAFIFFERYHCFHLNRYKLALRLPYSFSCYQTTNHGLCYLFLFLLCYMEGFLYFFIIILHLVTSKKHQQANKDACCAGLVLGIFMYVVVFFFQSGLGKQSVQIILMMNRFKIDSQIPLTRPIYKTRKEIMLLMVDGLLSRLSLQNGLEEIKWRQ